MESLKLQMHLAFVVLEGNYLLNYFETKLNLFYKKILKKMKLFFESISIVSKMLKKKGEVGACSLVINLTMSNLGGASSNPSFLIL